MSPEEQQIELLISMAERLLVAIEADIVALKAGRPQQMRMIDPDIQQLSAMYAREAARLDPKQAKSAPPELRGKLLSVMTRFRDALGQHTRHVTRIKNASEGIIKAVAEEVERRRTQMRPYTAAVAPRPTHMGAMVYNNVV